MSGFTVYKAAGHSFKTIIMLARCSLELREVRVDNYLFLENIRFLSLLHSSRGTPGRCMFCNVARCDRARRKSVTFQYFRMHWTVFKNDRGRLNIICCTNYFYSYCFVRHCAGRKRRISDNWKLSFYCRAWTFVTKMCTIRTPNNRTPLMVANREHCDFVTKNHVSKSTNMNGDPTTGECGRHITFAYPRHNFNIICRFNWRFIVALF